MFETETDRGLAGAMAAVQHHHTRAAKEIADGRIGKAEYHLHQAFFALGDYLIEDDEWTIEATSDADA